MRLPSIRITRIIPTLPGAVFWGRLGISLFLMKSQIEVGFHFILWNITIYYVFKKFEQMTFMDGKKEVPVGVRVTHISGVEIDAMSRDELIHAVKSLATDVVKKRAMT